MPRRAKNPIDIHVGARVRMARLAAGLSQEQLAGALGVTFQQVQKYEKGTNRFGAGRLYDAAKVLKVTVGYFFESAGGKPSADNPELDAITGALSTSEGIRIAQSLSRITDPRLRRSIADMLEAMVVLERRQAVA
jgi:transcriptional regulator with XRE-family HTH domain